MKIFEDDIDSLNEGNLSATLKIGDDDRFSYQEYRTTYGGTGGGWAHGVWHKSGDAIILRAEHVEGGLTLFSKIGDECRAIEHDDFIEFAYGFKLRRRRAESAQMPPVKIAAAPPIAEPDKAGQTPPTAPAIANLHFLDGTVRVTRLPHDSLFGLFDQTYYRLVDADGEVTNTFRLRQNGIFAGGAAALDYDEIDLTPAPKVPDFDRLLKRLETGDRATFRDDLDALVQNYGTSRGMGDVARLASKNTELRTVLLQLAREYGQASRLGLFAFHTVRRLGPAALPDIRAEWSADEDAPGIHHLHICLMDIIGASGNDEEWRRLMPLVAAREIPLWAEILRASRAKSRGLIAWALGAFTKHAPAYTGSAARFLLEYLAEEDIQTHVVRGLILIGDRAALQEALFRLARFARDANALDLLLSQAKNIDVHARDATGKTAQMHAEAAGNEKIAEILARA